MFEFFNSVDGLQQIKQVLYNPNLLQEIAIGFELYFLDFKIMPDETLVIIDTKTNEQVEIKAKI